MDFKSQNEKHPFLLESLYRMVAEETNGGDIRDPEKVLAPLIGMYHRMRESYFRSAREAADERMQAILDEEYQKPWWRLMPLTLPPYQSHHELSLVYAHYRLMTSGNMTFLVAKALGDALFNTDFSVSMQDLKFPSDTFTIYYRDSSIPVGASHLKWLFVDRVVLNPTWNQLRIIFGFVDEDGDYANSDFFLFDYHNDDTVNSEELFRQIDEEEVSSLSQRKITDANRRDSRNILTALFNFLLYLSISEDRRVVPAPDYLKRLEKLQNPKKRRRLMKEMEHQTIYRYTYIGGNYETKVEEVVGGSGEALDHKVLVRGHWRHQWTGRQRDEEGNRIPGTSQKLIWIEPYWKGPDVQDGKTTIRVVR
jgi:hypothetical protein